MKKFLRLSNSNRIPSERGQSLVEIAIFLPIFILLIAGIAEMGWYINHYLNLLDASREGARYGADLDPIGGSGNVTYHPQFNRASPLSNPSATYSCLDNASLMNDFYAVVACYTEDNLPENLDPATDDIVVSAFTIEAGNVKYRFPDYLDQSIYGQAASDEGWSYLGNHVSNFSSSDIDAMYDDATSPKQGILVVEIFYLHQQILALPFFTIFVPRDIGIHVYTIMPNPTAGTQ